MILLLSSIENFQNHFRIYKNENGQNISCIVTDEELSAFVSLIVCQAGKHNLKTFRYRFE